MPTVLILLLLYWITSRLYGITTLQVCRSRSGILWLTVLSVLLLFCDLSGWFDEEQGLGACLVIPWFLVRVLDSLFQCRYPLCGNNIIMLSSKMLLTQTSAGSLIQHIQLLVCFNWNILPFLFNSKHFFQFPYCYIIIWWVDCVNNIDWLKSQKKTIHWQVTNYDNPPSLAIGHWSVQLIILSYYQTRNLRFSRSLFVRSSQ